MVCDLRVLNEGRPELFMVFLEHYQRYIEIKIKSCVADTDKGSCRDVFLAQIVYPIYIRFSSSEIQDMAGELGRERMNNEAGGVAAYEVGAG